MTVVARGTVQDRPWGRTLSFVADRRFSGELVVDADNRRYVIAFDDGAVVTATSPLATDAAVRVALTVGLVTSSQVAEINRQVAAQPDLDEVEAVAAAARLGKDQADRLRRRVIAHKAIRGFALDRGDFVLTSDRKLAFTADHAIDVRALIYLGARTHMTEQRLLQELARVGPGFQLRPDAISNLLQYGFGEAEKPLLSALRAAPVAVLDVDAAAGELDPRTARAVVYALAVTNAVEVASSSVGSDGPRTRPPSTGVDRLRKPSMSQSADRVRKPSSSPGFRPEGSTDAPRTRAPSESGFERPGRRTGSTPVLHPASEPGTIRTKRGSDPPRTRHPSEPSVERPSRRTTTNPVGRSQSEPALKPPSDPSVERPRKGSIATAMPGADESGRFRVRASSSPPTPPPVPRAAAGTATPPLGPIDSKAHRRPARRSTLHQVNVPVAGEVRELIRDRAALIDQGADHFVLLGVDREAPADQIRRVYFGLARQLHPDRLTALGIADEDREAQRLFAQINTAFAVLSSPARRAEYRRTLMAGGEQVVRAQQDQAEALTRKVLAADEQFRIGEMALRRDQLDVALQHFKHAVHLNPDEADHHALLGWTMFVSAADKTAMAKESRTMLEKAVRMAPKAVAPHLYLGRMARMLGRDKEAIDQFEEVLRLSPGHVEAGSELRILTSRQGAPKEPPDGGKGGGGLFGRFRKP